MQFIVVRVYICVCITYIHTVAIMSAIILYNEYIVCTSEISSVIETHCYIGHIVASG